jgi:hypothetical protein
MFTFYQVAKGASTRLDTTFVSTIPTRARQSGTGIFNPSMFANEIKRTFRWTLFATTSFHRLQAIALSLYNQCLENEFLS